MIGSGSPWDQKNAKELRKRGDDLFYATNSNLLYAREGEKWICFGHVAHDIEVPVLNEDKRLRLQGVPY